MTQTIAGVRVRFAPSPTGALHVGGARTALFNYLFARRHGGVFIVRIEDTDRTRSTAESEREIFESMEWMGLRSDEPVQRQTDRMPRYAQVAADLLERGTAYRCVCTADKVQADRAAAEAVGGAYRYPGTCRELASPLPSGTPYVIRLKVPTGEKVVVDDQVRGEVTFASDQVDDWILVRSDGNPTYNFTVVVDDTDMGITHVIRGEDHLANTPKQILCYRAMGKPPPLFAHVSMILGSDRTKLSKRHGATSVRSYREQGFLASGFLNYLARLGWSHGDREIFTLRDMEGLFDLGQVNPAAAVFDPEKLAWVNAQHLKELSDDGLLEALRAHVRFTSGGATGDLGLLFDDADYSRRIVASLRTRSRTLVELLDGARVFLADAVMFEAGLAEKFLTPEGSSLLAEAERWLGARDSLEAVALEADFRAWCGDRGWKLGDVAQPLRVALTGRKASPPIFQVIEILGRQRTLARLAAVRARN